MNLELLPPKARRIFKEETLSWLYAPRKESLMRQLHAICKEQAQLTGNLNYGFRYKGETYATQDSLPDFRYNRLHPNLVDSAQDYLQAIKDYEHERLLVDNCITQALIKCKCTQDFERILPRAVLQPLHKYLGTNRDEQHRLALTTEQVEAFKTQYAQALKIISAGLVRRTLEA